MEDAMRTAMKGFLDTLEAIRQDHKEVTDTVVREKIGTAVDCSFVDGDAKYKLPATYGMFSPKGNAKVREALAVFIGAACNAGERDRSARRLELEDESITSDFGRTFLSYVGLAMNDEEARLSREADERHRRAWLESEAPKALRVLTQYVANRCLGPEATQHIAALELLIRIG